MSNFGSESDSAWAVFLGLGFVIGWVALAAFILMVLWGWLVPALLPGFVTKGFIAPTITFLQALCLSMFTKLSGFGVSTSSSKK